MKCDQNRELLPISLVFLIVLRFICATETESNSAEETIIEDFFICRTCGNDVSLTNLAFDKYSPLALSATNHTFSEKRTILVQEVQNPRGIRFNIFLVKQANCAKVHPVKIPLANANSNPSDSDWSEQQL
ncbi:AGAP004264-PA-like protein [Anopheles sinensis]|uniref:AGAP004264-PA-like protein n=1 Tax=Anopheles sinensis TaxID=74873 RepID=A0A084WP00_ANOSI|nr:AGAP004264-PA-like protein [Anopheles sinensis]